MTEVHFIHEHKSKNLAEVALLLSKHPELDKIFVLNQINGIQKSKNKLPDIAAKEGVLFPSKLSLEQCSSEETATYKSKIIKGNTLVDLTGGFGIDSYYFSQLFESITYVEPNNELFTIVKANFNTLGVNNSSIINQTAEEFLNTNEGHYDVAYIDPSRRNENERVYRLEDCVPNIIKLAPTIFKITDKILVKTAPLLDIKQSLKDLKNVSQVYVISVNNECKEVLYLLEKNYKETQQIHAINLGKSKQEITFDYPLENDAKVTYSEPLHYLYEPNASLLKAGAFNFIADRFKVKKIAPNTHIYTSVEIIDDFPGRAFKIEHVLPYQPKKFKKLGIKKANVSCRNFKDSVEHVKKKLNLKDGGDHYIFLFNTYDGKPIVAVSKKNEN